MTVSPLRGRRIHITGSIVEDVAVASTEEVKRAQELVSCLTRALIARGANFVVPIDAEPTRRTDGLPLCFDWVVWQAIADNMVLRPRDVPGPVAIAVQHYKSEDQIPAHRVALWDSLRASPQVVIENAAFWNMAAKRMEAQARAGDILITLGGGEGVLYLANLYHAAGKPVIPLNLALSPENTGSRRLYAFGLTSSQTPDLFRTTGDVGPHGWLNRIHFPARQSVPDRVAQLIDLLEALEAPRAFAVRLLNPKVPEFAAVEAYFETVVKSIIEGELGFRLIVVDGQQAYEHPRIDEEIFARLHRSGVVLADLTGQRPNCFLELGYALGRGLPTMVMAREGTPLPFDIVTFSGLLWDDEIGLKEQRDAFRTHWQAIRNRPPLVSLEPLIS